MLRSGTVPALALVTPPPPPLSTLLHRFHHLRMIERPKRQVEGMHRQTHRTPPLLLSLLLLVVVVAVLLLLREMTTTECPSEVTSAGGVG